MKSDNILIIGSGVSGLGAAQLARKLNYNVRVTSKDAIGECEKNIFSDLSIEFEEYMHSKSNIHWADLIVKSPGIASDTTFLKQVKKEGVLIISEIEFAYRNTDANIIAITGTNGKTTTSTLLWHILNNAGLNVGLVGNIGYSFSESVMNDKYDYYVLEVSSFQLEDIYDFKPNVSIILNIAEDHLDRYNQKIDDYISAKMKITMNQDSVDSFIYFSDDNNINNKLSSIKSKKYPFSCDKKNHNQLGAWINNNQIIIKTIKNHFTMTIHNLALQGTHNIYNSMAASIAASAIGIKDEIIKKSLYDFRGIEHRLEFVSRVAGVSFINDSKATNCNAVYYALETATSPIIWICGGVDKGNDYSILKDLVQRKVKAIIIIGKNGKKISNSFQKDVDTIVEVNNMEKAVKTSFEVADAADTVLLSPACSSFDLFKNYEERGRAFKNAVLSI